MPASVQDSAIYSGLLGDAEAARLFTDSAELRAMLIVEGALAQVQGDAGLIPRDAAAWLHRTCLDIQIDPATLNDTTATNGVPVPALIEAFRKTCGNPAFAQYLHWGATSQDIMDTGLILRIRQLLLLLDGRLHALLDALARQARAHAGLPMAARTYGQIATPTSLGAVVAGWGRPLLRLRDRLAELRPRLLVVQLGGAAGTLSVMGDDGPAIRAALAQALGLGDPGASWHAERDRIAELAAWMTALTATVGKMGGDLCLMAQSGIDEVHFAKAGASSTMPQKSNPVQAQALVALARHAAGVNATLQSAVLHRQQRDGGAWFTEWLALPQLCVSAARSLSLAGELAGGMVPDGDAMTQGLVTGHGVIHAEAITFALTGIMSRPAAQAAVSDLCKAARVGQRQLADLAAESWPEVDWAGALAMDAQIGTSHADALEFADRVQSGAK